MLHVRDLQPSSGENRCGFQNRLSRLADEEWRLLRQPMSQPVVILMRMRNHDAQQRIVRRCKAWDRMQGNCLRIDGIQGQSDIKDEPLSLRLDLDARSADFLGSTMDADAHEMFAC